MLIDTELELIVEFVLYIPKEFSFITTLLLLPTDIEPEDKFESEANIAKLLSVNFEFEEFIDTALKFKTLALPPYPKELFCITPSFSKIPKDLLSKLVL